MPKKQNLGEELKGFGIELAKAFNEMRTSKELKTLEKDLSKALKLISTSVVRSLKVAKDSDSAHRLTKKMKRVVDAGAVQGKIGAQKAQEAAADGLRQAKKLVGQLAEKIKDRSK
ncbi:MAG: hypothetical protein LHV69_03855 [Elusimicrobia bacterium]|nr:hypothetical protein [Candidatus Obscuribacterium magneticum]